MKKNVISSVLVVMWLISFLFCLITPLFFRRDIPSNFGPLIKQAFDTFGPALAVMVAFVFAEHTNAQTTRKNGENSGIFTSILALGVSVAYVGVFDFLMIMFILGKNRADETVELFQEYRPFLEFLVTGMIAYYFGKKPEKAK